MIAAIKSAVEIIPVSAIDSQIHRPAGRYASLPIVWGDGRREGV